MLTKSLLTIALIAVTTVMASAEWKKHPSGTMAWLHAIHFVDASRGWIVGSSGTLLETIDGGETWTAAKKITNDSIRDVYFADSLRGWLLCERSVFGPNETLAYLLVTNDGGKTWQMREPFRSRDRVVRLVFRNVEVGCAIGEGGYLSCTQDGGATWRRYELPTRYLMLDAWFTDHDRLVLAGGGGTVLHSERGATDWRRAVTPPEMTAKINSLYFHDGRTGWAVGAGGGIWFTKSGGQSWSGESSPVTRELRSVYFEGPSLGYAVGEDGAIIHTKSGGVDWKEESSGTHHRLERIAVAGHRIFAVGFGGTILVRNVEKGETAVEAPK